MLSPYLFKIGTPAIRKVVAQHLPTKNMREMKRLVDTMHDKCSEIYHSKKVALQKNDDAVTAQMGEGKDILSILSMSYISQL